MGDASMGDGPTLNNFYFPCEAKEVEGHLGSFSSSLDKNITCNAADSSVEICQAEPEGGSRGLIYIEIGTEIIEGLRG